MSVETATAILIVGAIVGAVVWLVGLWFLLASFRSRSMEPMADHFGLFEELPPHWTLGSVEVDGQPRALLDKAASILARQHPGSVKILEKTNDRFTFESL